jgi:hypothetical protein
MEKDKATPQTAQCQHTPSPANYLGWHGWAERMGKTHKQIRCEHCGLWAIWIPKGRGNKEIEGERTR